jgi:hypothetical protein
LLGRAVLRQANPVVLQCRERRPAGQHGHRAAGKRRAGGDPAADSARADYADRSDTRPLNLVLELRGDLLRDPGRHLPPLLG